MKNALPLRRTLALAIAALAMPLAPTSFAAQEVAPPVAHAWIDVATFSGFGMPAGMGGGNPMAALGGLFGGGGKSGGKGGGNSFGNTVSMSAGRWVDVTVRTRNNPNLAEAQQAVPEGFLVPALDLRAPQNVPPAPEHDGDIQHEPPEKPRGRILMYWGCGDTIRKGQPAVLDMATASIADYGKFFTSRSATQRGAHSAAGRPQWPNKADDRMLPVQASLVGEHAFAGNGIPEGFRFKLGPQQDLMPALALDQADRGGATELSWNAIPTARAYFASAMGGNDKEEMIVWTSSELADAGFGLMDYQTNPAVDKWLKEKVLLAPETTRCTVPRGIFPADGRGGGMVRLIAYGNELNLAHPPRPKDPKEKWEPIWAVKVRVKAVANGMLGMSAEDMRAMQGGMQDDERAPRERPRNEEAPKAPGAVDLLKGIFR